MQPPKPNLSDPYAHHNHAHHTHYSYSHLPLQNPNPNPVHYQHHHLPIHSHYSTPAFNPPPTAADPYLQPSYSLGHHPGLAYDPGGLNYAHSVGAPAPATYAVDPLVQQYGSTTYATGDMLSQDGTQQLLPAIPSPTMWTSPTVRPRAKKPPKKTKIAQSAWCEVCKVECNTKDVLNQHKLGKKHMKNLEKLKAAAVAPASNPTPVMSVPNNQIIGPVENPNKGNSGKKKKASETPEDLEIKRRKVLEGGAAENSVRTCSICNVVCNSDTVFRFHLQGQKHSSMLKKHVQGAEGMATTS